jgi:signal transduction histidine kinase
MAIAGTQIAHGSRLREWLVRDWPAAAWLLTAIVINVAGAKGASETYRQSVELLDIPAGDRAELIRSLANLHLTPEFIAWFGILTALIGSIVNMIIGWLLIRRAPRSGFMIYLAFIMLAMTNANYPPSIDDVQPGQPIAQAIVRLSTAVAITGFFTLPFLFPDGRFVPRWTVVWWIYAAASVFTFAFFPSFDPHNGVWVVVDTTATILLILLLVFAVIYRYRRVSTLEQQRQTKWVAFGLGISVPGFFAGDVMMRNIDATAVGIGCLIGFLIIMPIATTLPFVTIGVAILQHGLYDIDVILNRTLLWLGMTLAVIGTYIGIVIGVGTMIGSRGGLFLSLVATGAVAVAFQPLRERVQRAVNRLLYGDRDEPYAVLARLGQRLEGALAHEDVLPGIVRTLTDALRLPYAAIMLQDGPLMIPAAAAGTPVSGVTRLPLVYQNEPVGELVVAARSPGQMFGPADRRLLDDLARQIGVAVHAVRLTADLQRARQRVVSAREEERRRLRRDLHDSLGGQLAALSIQASVMRSLIPADPAAAAELAAEIRAELKSAVGDIRRLVHGLRPPALDELGLVGALRQRALQYGAGGVYQTADGTQAGDPHLSVSVISPDALPPLTAAVEVAAYRIAEEALTNVARHASARTCVVRVEAADELLMTIQDDGVGISPGRTGGVGLRSMRERAEELGGALSIGPNGSGPGTHVTACLPFDITESR